MLFYIIRILFLGLLVTLSLIIFKTKKVPMYKTNSIKSTYGEYSKTTLTRQAIIQIVIVLLLFCLSFYPFEGMFIRFSSIQSSLKYSNINYNWSEINSISDTNCTFIFAYNDNSLDYHSISQYIDGFGLTDYDSEIKNYNTTLIYNLEIFCSANSVYNKYADKTCLFINTQFVNEDSDLQITCNNIPLNDYYSPYNECRVYYLIIDGNISDDKIDLKINNEAIQLNKSIF